MNVNVCIDCSFSYYRRRVRSSLGQARFRFDRRCWSAVRRRILNLIPGQQNGILGLLVVFGLAIAGGFAGFFIKTLGKLLGMGIGFLAGGAITLAVLGVLGIDLGIFQFLLALVGGLVGLVLVSRFFDWTIIILARLTGALLVTRGLELLTGEFSGAIGTLIWIVLAALGFVNLSRRQAAKAPAARQS